MAFASRADKWCQSKLSPAKRQTYRDRKCVSNTRKELGETVSDAETICQQGMARDVPQGCASASQC